MYVACSNSYYMYVCQEQSMNMEKAGLDVIHNTEEVTTNSQVSSVALDTK